MSGLDSAHRIMNLSAIEPSNAPRQRRSAVAAILLFAIVATFLSYRVLARANFAGPAQPGEALADFRDAAYYPAKALSDGNNPYDPVAFVKTYPVSLPLPLYSPMALALYLPLTLFSFPTAATIFCLLNVALTPVLVWLALRLSGLGASVGRVFTLAAFLLISRGGYLSLFFGQCSTYVVIGTYVALLAARERPGLAGLGLALATLKPTFGGPLAILMAARRDFRAVIIGLALGGLGALGPTVALVHNAGGLTPFTASLQASHRSYEEDPYVNPASSRERIDSAVLAGRLAGPAFGTQAEFALTLLLVGIGAAALWRLSAGETGSTRVQSAGLVCLTIAVCIYHQAYELALLAMPLVACCYTASARRMNVDTQLRWLLIALLAAPMANYLMSSSVLSRLSWGQGANLSGWFLVAASLNSFCILSAFCIAVGLAFRHSAHHQPVVTASDMIGRRYERGC